MSDDDTPTAGETISEIAARFGRARGTVSSHWCYHPDWPKPIGKRRYSYVYDPQAVDAWIDQPDAPTPAVDWIPEGLYSLRDISAATGLKLGTLRSRVNTGKWPPADDTSGTTHLWFGQTIASAMSHRRRSSGRSRSAPSCKTDASPPS